MPIQACRTGVERSVAHLPHRTPTRTCALCHRNWLIFPVSVTQTLIVVARHGDLTHLTGT